MPLLSFSFMCSGWNFDVDVSTINCAHIFIAAVYDHNNIDPAPWEEGGLATTARRLAPPRRLHR